MNSEKQTAVHFGEEDVEEIHINESFAAFVEKRREKPRPYYVIDAPDDNQYWIVGTNIENLSNTQMCELAKQQKEKIYNMRRSEYDEAHKGSRGKRPQKEKCFQDAVVVLDKHHSIEELVEIGRMIERELGFTLYAATLHHDEGRFEQKNPPNERVNDVIYDQRSRCYMQNGKKIADTLEEMSKIYNVKFNYHAHLHFVTINKEGQQRRVVKMINKLSKIQTKAAEILKMRRGDFGSKKKHLKRNDFIAIDEAKKRNEAELAAQKAEQEKELEKSWQELAAAQEQNKQERAKLAEWNDNLNEDQRNLNEIVDNKVQTQLEQENSILTEFARYDKEGKLGEIVAQAPEEKQGELTNGFLNAIQRNCGVEEYQILWERFKSGFNSVIERLSATFTHKNY